MIIDIHNHAYPRNYLDTLIGRHEVPLVDRREDGDHLLIFRDEERYLGPTPPLTAAFHDPTVKRQAMEAAGIDAALVSAGNPWVDFVPVPEAAERARWLNEEIVRFAASEPGLYAIGVLPLQDPGAAVTEIDRLADDRVVHGVMIGTRPGGWSLDAPSMEPVWAALELRRVPVILHPHYCVGYDHMGGYGHALPLALGFPYETAAAAARLVLAGVPERYPDLRIVLVHGGGALPMLAGRLETCATVDRAARTLMSGNVSDYLRWFLYDALVYGADALRLLVATVGVDRIMFGTDDPFGIADMCGARGVVESAIPDLNDRRAVLGNNARRLFEV